MKRIDFIKLSCLGLGAILTGCWWKPSTEKDEYRELRRAWKALKATKGDADWRRAAIRYAKAEERLIQ